MTVGSFVMVNAFMIQITMPLNFLGTVYREIRQSLVDMREMYANLSDQGAEVDRRTGCSRPDWITAPVRFGFENVAFAYSEDRSILRGCQLRHQTPGNTVAVVGPSGCGQVNASQATVVPVL